MRNIRKPDAHAQAGVVIGQCNAAFVVLDDGLHHAQPQPVAGGGAAGLAAEKAAEYFLVFVFGYSATVVVNGQLTSGAER